MVLLHVFVLQAMNRLMIMIFFSVAKISTNATLVNQVIFAEVLPNASTMTVDTTVNAKALGCLTI